MQRAELVTTGGEATDITEVSGTCARAIRPADCDHRRQMASQGASRHPPQARDSKNPGDRTWHGVPGWCRGRPRLPPRVHRREGDPGAELAPHCGNGRGPHRRRPGRQSETCEVDSGRTAAAGKRRCSGGRNSRGRLWDTARTPSEEASVDVRWHGSMSKRHPGSRRYAALDRKRWQLLRLRVFARDGWRCVECGGAGRLECDHVIPMRHGVDPYNMGNLQSLCRSCHIEKTRAESKPPDPARDAWRALVAEIANTA